MNDIFVQKPQDQWDEISNDSGFSSDVDKNSISYRSRQHKTRSLYCDVTEIVEEHDFRKKSSKSDNSRSLPSSFRHQEERSFIIWSDIGLSDFDHVRYLGGGGYARVDLIRMNKYERKDYFALKKISKKLVADAKQLCQYEAEKEVLLMAKSRFIPRLYKTFSSPNHVFLLTEACLGGDLFSYLERYGPAQPSTARFIVGCVLEALDYLHNILHVIHRDVKTENLLIGERGTVKLADFGFCKSMSSNQTQTFTFCGTPGYVAPELILRNGHSYSADYFSLGVVSYEVLTCRSPFRRPALMDTYKATIRGITDVAFPNYLDHVTRTFIRALCYREADRRLCVEAREHEWFCDFAWSQLKSGEMVSPLICNVK